MKFSLDLLNKCILIIGIYFKKREETVLFLVWGIFFSCVSVNWIQLKGPSSNFHFSVLHFLFTPVIFCFHLSPFLSLWALKTHSSESNDSCSSGCSQYGRAWIFHLGSEKRRWRQRGTVTMEDKGEKKRWWESKGISLGIQTSLQATIYLLYLFDI